MFIYDEPATVAQHVKGPKPLRESHFARIEISQVLF